MSGRYTAFHVYQGLSFPEADRAATRPYKLPEYRCAHSQRGYLFQFESMAERNHFDAATTTCCDEPVMNFHNKPQWASSAKPMNPRDCSNHITSTGCETLEVSIEDSAGVCASQTAKIRRIKIKCPSVCPEFAAIQSAGSYRGRYGVFRSLGMEAGEIMILDYTPDSQTLDAVYDSCRGAVTFTEEFCNGRTLSFEVRGGLDFPGGCGCDCCGYGGIYAAPVMNLSVPLTVQGGPGNSVGSGIVISADPACQGAEITGVFHGSFGPVDVLWDNSTVYNSDGVTRFVTRDSPLIGDEGNPSCCGGSVEWTATDGCASIKSVVTSVAPGIGASSLWPASGTVVYEDDGLSFNAMGACSYSLASGIGIETACLANSVSDLYRFDGYLTRNIDSTLAFENDHACSGCCGNGEIDLTFANGCGPVITASYPVRRRLSDSAYADCIGRVFRCERFFRSFTPVGYYYRLAVADLMCDGNHGEFTNPVAGYYSEIADCLALIDGPAASAITGPVGCAGLTGGDTCCFYADNGMDGLEFMSSVVSVSGRKCCRMETSNGSWVNGGPAGGCCPNG
jgi:hypothetical protein